MPIRTRFYLNGSLINPPLNHKALQLEINFDKEKFSEQVTVNDWELVRENSGYIQEWIEGGLTGGVGVFEGVPFRAEIERNGQIETPFDGYLDLTDSGSFSCNRSVIKAKERQQIDWLNDVADSFTYEYLYRETGEITKDDFVFMPYVINSIPDYQQSAIALLSTYIITQALKDAIEKFKELVPKLGWYLTSVPSIIEAVLLVAYITLLIISLIKLIKDMIYFLIQPVKYHAGMYAKKLLEVGASHLGLTFDSDIFNQAPFDKLFILPEKLFNPIEVTQKNILGFIKPNKNSQEGFYKGTFGQLLREMKAMFNAKIIISGTNLTLVRRDYNPSTAQFTLPDIYQPFYKINADEFVSNYYLKFQYDTLDKNTIQYYTGTSYQVILSPKVVNNRDLILMKHLDEIPIGFALAKRKESLTVPEQIMKALLDAFSPLVNGIISVVNVVISVANGVIKAVNKIISVLKGIGIKLKVNILPIPKLKFVGTGASIDNRVGMLLLETDAFGVGKALLLTEGSQVKFNKLHVNNQTLLSAKSLYDNFHFINSFLPSTEKPNANQYIIKEFVKVPFCFDDYVKVKNNNVIFVNGGEAEIQSLKWNVYNEQAEIVLRINQLYTNNLIATTIEPDGR